MLVAFFDEAGFSKQYPNFRIRPGTVGVILVTYCSSGDGGEPDFEAFLDQN